MGNTFGRSLKEEALTLDSPRDGTTVAPCACERCSGSDKNNGVSRLFLLAVTTSTAHSLFAESQAAEKIPTQAGVLSGLADNYFPTFLN